MLRWILGKTSKIKYKFFYPGTLIGNYVSISKDSSFGDGAVIGDHVTIKSSTFGKSANVVDRSLVVGSRCEDNVMLVDAQIHNSEINSHVAIYNGCRLSNVVVDKYSYFAMGSLVSMASFGRFCSVGPYLLCGYGNHPTNFVSTSPIFFSTLRQCGVSFTDEGHFEEREKVEVGNDVWIGAKVFIRDGITVGDGAIIAAGSIVVKDVPDYAIVGGAPAKIIRYRFDEETINKFLKVQWWNWSEEKLRVAQPYFITEDLSGFFDWAKTDAEAEPLAL
ncbi:CatB-related O-acetyltransferase [Trichloromonas sp.]|uniref:xenobiotic acyltransferase family protein n=1 Tax=Trichloromonas sp. TaxID=3069249 RepID=UPI003D81AFC8